MGAQEHLVELTGDILPGYETAEVVSSLAQLFKLPPARARALLASAPRTIKRTPSSEDAQRYARALSSIGAGCTISISEQESEPATQHSDVATGAARPAVPSRAAGTESPVVTRHPADSQLMARLRRLKGKGDRRLARRKASLGIGCALALLAMLSMLTGSSWTFFFIVATAFWVYIDARTLGVTKREDVEGMFNLSPGMWAAGTMLLWILVFPAYLWKRSSFAALGNQATGRGIVGYAALGTVTVLALIAAVVPNEDTSAQSGTNITAGADESAATASAPAQQRVSAADLQRRLDGAQTCDALAAVHAEQRGTPLSDSVAFHRGVLRRVARLDEKRWIAEVTKSDSSEFKVFVDQRHIDSSGGTTRLRAAEMCMLTFMPDPETEWEGAVVKWVFAKGNTGTTAAQAAPAPEFPYTAHFACTFRGRTDNLLTCLANSEIRVRTGGSTELYNLTRLATRAYRSGRVQGGILEVDLKDDFEIRAMNSDSVRTLELRIEDASGSTVYEDMAGSYGSIAVQN